MCILKFGSVVKQLRRGKKIPILILETMCKAEKTTGIGDQHLTQGNPDCLRRESETVNFLRILAKSHGHGSGENLPLFLLRE